MTKKKDHKNFCAPPEGGMGCCNVEAFVSIDERGQMVLPKDIREKANINPGDKLTLVTCQTGEKIQIIALIKADNFSEMVKDFMGPVMGNVFSK
jgi:AbrB family looped-hinge helix DNA binding protein